MAKTLKWKWIGTALAATFLFSAAIAWQLTRPGPLAQDKAVVLAKGLGVEAIGDALEEQGIIRASFWFRVAALISAKHRRLRAGEYAFAAHTSVWNALELLTEGKTVLRRITVPEGLTVNEIRALLLAETALTGEVPERIAEGSLLPETYRFSYGDRREEIVERMERGMREVLSDAWEKRAEGLPLATPAEAQVLASIVEKETGVADERARVAAVFVNRLKKGMKLQSDPTTVYAILHAEGAMNRALTLDDLERRLPFNTYWIDGLPPAPICNPGKAAIEAALHPAPTDELYFVATGDGGHRFAATFEEHTANVRQYRARMKQKSLKK